MSVPDRSFMIIYLKIFPKKKVKISTEKLQYFETDDYSFWIKTYLKQVQLILQFHRKHTYLYIFKNIA